MAEVGTAYVTIIPSARGFASNLDKSISGDVAKSGSSQGKKFGLGFGKSFALVGGALGIAGIVKSSSQLEQAFSKTMAQVAVATGAPKTQLKALDALAMKMGADTAFSANEAADAMLELGKSGISTKDILGGGLKGTLLLATAGSTSLGTAATIASNAMNTFNLEGKDMNSIAAALAGGANASSASVESLGQGLQQVGPGARNAGLSLQQTVGALSAFDAAGIKGSDAGTSLKTMLSRLIPTTNDARDAMRKYNLDFVDGEGNFKKITNVAEQLRTKLGPLSEAQRQAALTTIFGSDATRAATVLMNEGSKGLAKYISATKDQGAAQRAADAAMSGTAGAMERLRGSVETAQLALGKALAPTITSVANTLSNKVIPAVTTFVTQMRSGQGAGGRFAEALGNIVNTAKGVVGFFVSLPGPVQQTALKLLLAGVAINKLNGFLGPSVSKLGAFVTSLGSAEFRAATFASKMGQVGSALRGVAGAGGLALIADSTTRAAGGFSTLESAAGGALTGASLGAFAGPPGAAVGAAIGGLAGAAIGLSRNTKTAGQKARESIGSWQAYGATLDATTGKVTELTRQEVYNRLQKSGLLNTTRSLGIADREAVAGVTQQGAAREKLRGTIAATIETMKIGIERQKYLEKVGTGGARAAATEKRKEYEERVKNLQALGKEVGSVDRASAAWQRQNKVLRNFSARIKSLPPKLQTELKTKGMEKTRAAVVDLTKRYHLLPEDVRTLIKENGGKPTKKMVDGIIKDAKELGRQHPTVKISAKDNVSPSVQRINRALAGMHDKTITLREQHIVSTIRKVTTLPGERRAAGGPISPRQTYLVGERGPELFTSSQAGRIIPNNQLSSVPGGGGLDGGRVLILRVGEREFRAYTEEVADGRVAASASLAGQPVRGGRVA